MWHPPLFVIHTLQARRAAVLGSAALCAALSITFSPTPVAHAALGTCNGDPIVVLTNGAIIDLHAKIADAKKDVQHVTYMLHAPAGTGTISIVDASLLGPQEAVQFYADNQPNTYSVTTIVSTETPGISVTAATSVLPLLGLPASASTSGAADQSLQVSITAGGL